MSDKLYSKPRSFDYLEKQGLEKLTDTEAGNWHLYILKELIDNALDANDNASSRPVVVVHLAYRSTGELLIWVENSAPFPIERIEDLFNLETYWSTKDYVIGVTRGKQGNGLKTILSMPYAISRYSVGSFDLEFTPLIVACGKLAVSIGLAIDEFRQEVRPQVFSRLSLNEEIGGTRIEVRLARFLPETPVTCEEVSSLARQFAITNPDTTFQWRIDVDGATPLHIEFEKLSNSVPKLLNIPVQWYRKDRFTRLIKYLQHSRKLTVEYLWELFIDLGLSVYSNPKLIADVSQLLDEELTEQRIIQLKQLLSLASNTSSAFNRMVALPKTTVNRINQCFSVDGHIVQGTEQSLPNDEGPCLIDLFIFRANEQDQRTIWVALNHSPLLRSPFDRKKIKGAKTHKNERRFLSDILTDYGVRYDDNVCILIHLLYPTVEFQSFGKSEFDFSLIENLLSQLIHRTVTLFHRHNPLKNEEKKLSKFCSQAMNEFVKKHQAFTPRQLYFRSLQLAYSANFQARNIGFSRFALAIVPFAKKGVSPLARDLLRDESSIYFDPHKSSAILWILKPKMLDMLVDIGIVEEMRVSCFFTQIKQVRKSFAELKRRLSRNRKYKIVLFHDADMRSAFFVSKLLKFASDKQFPNFSFYDLGLTPKEAKMLEIAPLLNFNKGQESCSNVEKHLPSDYIELHTDRCRYDLFSLSADQISKYLRHKLVELGIVEILSNRSLIDSIRAAILENLVHGLRKRLIEQYEVHEKVTVLLARHQERVVERLASFVSQIDVIDNARLHKNIGDFTQSIIEDLLSFEKQSD